MSPIKIPGKWRSRPTTLRCQGGRAGGIATPHLVGRTYRNEGSPRQNGYAVASPLIVTHCHWVNSSQLAGPPMLAPFPDAPRPPNGLTTWSSTVWSLMCSKPVFRRLPMLKARPQALRGAHRRGARVVGLCLGVFPLAQAGLLDGRTATTHWGYASTLSERHPKVKVNRDVLYVDEGDVLTSAGVAAGLDCCLHLLRQICGAELANKVARQLVIASHRQGGQAQFIERPLPVSNSDGRFSQVLEWVTEHLGQTHSIDELAQRAAMSQRNFTRHFRQATGTSFKQWLLNQRLAHAQWLLESGDASIEVVAQEAGFGSTLSLRQHFRTVLRTSPSAYRKVFRSNMPTETD